MLSIQKQKNQTFKKRRNKWDPIKILAKIRRLCIRVHSEATLAFSTPGRFYCPRKYETLNDWLRLSSIESGCLPNDDKLASVSREACISLWKRRWGRGPFAAWFHLSSRQNGCLSNDNIASVFHAWCFLCIEFVLAPEKMDALLPNNKMSSLTTGSKFQATNRLACLDDGKIFHWNTCFSGNTNIIRYASILYGAGAKSSCNEPTAASSVSVENTCYVIT